MSQNIKYSLLAKNKSNESVKTSSEKFTIAISGQVLVSQSVQRNISNFSRYC